MIKIVTVKGDKMSKSLLEKKVTNLRGMYFEKELGDGTTLTVVRKRRPDDDTWALAIVLRVGTKTATCFLEDKEGKCFVDELTDGLLDYMEDVSNIIIEKSEEDGEAFILRKEQKAKNDKK